MDIFLHFQTPAAQSWVMMKTTPNFALFTPPPVKIWPPVKVKINSRKTFQTDVGRPNYRLNHFRCIDRRTESWNIRYCSDFEIWCEIWSLKILLCEYIRFKICLERFKSSDSDAIRALPSLIQVENLKLSYRRNSARRRTLRWSRSLILVPIESRGAYATFPLVNNTGLQQLHPISHRLPDIAQYFSNIRFYDRGVPFCNEFVLRIFKPVRISP